MRLFCRVFLIVLLVVVAARAADSRKPVLQERTLTPPNADVNHQSPADATREFSVTVDKPRKIPSDQIQLRQPCLSMRSMKFSRSGSDVVRLEGVTTCTPARQFQVQRAVLPAPTP